jgi:acyl-CoA thioesterase I
MLILKDTRLTLYLFLALIFVSSNSYADSNSYAENKMQIILVMGDSLSAGYGIDPKLGWVNLLQENFLSNNVNNNVSNKKGQMINASVSGETTNGGATRLPALIAKHNPTIVIIELGANDGLRGQPLKLMQNNLQLMIDMCKKSGAEVLLVGMQIPTNYGQRYTREFKQIYPQLSEKNKITLVPFLLENVATKTDLFQDDGLHPNAQAQPLIANNVWAQLKKMMAN